MMFTKTEVATMIIVIAVLSVIVSISTIYPRDVVYTEGYDQGVSDGFLEARHFIGPEIYIKCEEGIGLICTEIEEESRDEKTFLCEEHDWLIGEADYIIYNVTTKRYVPR